MSTLFFAATTGTRWWRQNWYFPGSRSGL